MSRINKRKTSISKVLLLTLGGILCLMFLLKGIPLQASSYEEKLKAAEQAKLELEEKKKQTEKKIADLEREKDDILKYIEKLDNELNEITLEVERLQKEMEETRAELEITRQQLVLAKQTEEKQYDTMKKRIQYMYENGSMNVIELLFDSDSFVDFLNQVEFAKKISEYDNDLFQNYRKTKELITQKEADLVVQLEELNILEESAEFEKSTLEQLVENKSAEIERYVEVIGANDELLFSYSEEIVKKKMSIEEIKKEEERRIAEEQRKIKEEQERLRREEEQRRLNAAQGIVQKNETAIDQMIWPLPGDGRIYSRFGPRVAPTKGASTYHRGVDIGGEMGASIVAVLSGTVETAGYSYSSGNYIIIDHGNGVRSAYCHCSKLLVKAGETVKQGKVIALLGSTGISTGPHLHFGISLNRTYVDPLDYISY